MNNFQPADRNTIVAAQLAKLKALLAELLSTNPFYTRKLLEAGISPAISGLEEFAASMPFTLKHEIVADQMENPPYGSNLTYPLERYTRFSQTSGTTANPIRWLDTPESWDWMLDNWSQVYKKAGVARRDHIFFAFSFAPFLGFWTAFESAARIGCLCIPGGGLSSAARLRIMLDNNVTVLCCAPTYTVRLAEVAVEEGVDLAALKVRTIIVAGEPGGSIPATRARIEQLWKGVRIVDHHGMTEVGPVSYGCPEKRNMLHVIESSYIAEIVNPGSEKPVEAGGMGELVLTTLGRTGSPLLRYRTGDWVQPIKDQPCACGSYELALQGGILGRTDDMVIIRGVNVYPSAVEDIVRGFPGVAEYRVEIFSQQALPEMKMQVELVPACKDEAEVAAHLEAALQKAFALRIPVIIVPGGTLPRFEMKARRWVRV